MMYPFMTLEDKTEVVHSDTYEENGAECVKVYFERPVMGGFDSAECYLPAYEWKNVEGFSEAEIKSFQELVESTAHVIIQLAREGGLELAANF